MTVASDRMMQFLNESVPFHRFIGLQVVEAGGGTAKVTLAFRPEFIGDPQRPALHGALLATLIDVACGAAVLAVIDARDSCSTVDFRVDFLRPGQALDLICEAKVLRTGSRVAATSAIVHHGNPEEPIADGRAVYNVVRRPAH
jgi:uncharacterized protein (TIGR00369 family)